MYWACQRKDYEREMKYDKKTKKKENELGRVMILWYDIQFLAAARCHLYSHSWSSSHTLPSCCPHCCQPFLPPFVDTAFHGVARYCFSRLALLMAWLVLSKWLRIASKSNRSQVQQNIAKLLHTFIEGICRPDPHAKARFSPRWKNNAKGLRMVQVHPIYTIDETSQNT